MMHRLHVLDVSEENVTTDAVASLISIEDILAVVNYTSVGLFWYLLCEAGRKENFP